MLSRARLTRPVTAALGLAALLIPLMAGTTSAIELRDAEIVAGGAPDLQNFSGTVRVVDARLGRVGPVTLVPEPGALWQLGSGAVLLVLLERCRSRHTSRRSSC